VKEHWTAYAAIIIASLALLANAIQSYISLQAFKDSRTTTLILERVKLCAEAQQHAMSLVFAASPDLSPEQLVAEHGKSEMMLSILGPRSLADAATALDKALVDLVVISRKGLPDMEARDEARDRLSAFTSACKAALGEFRLD